MMDDRCGQGVPGYLGAITVPMEPELVTGKAVQRTALALFPLFTLC